MVGFGDIWGGLGTGGLSTASNKFGGPPAPRQQAGMDAASNDLLNNVVDRGVNGNSDELAKQYGTGINSGLLDAANAGVQQKAASTGQSSGMAQAIQNRGNAAYSRELGNLSTRNQNAAEMQQSKRNEVAQQALLGQIQFQQKQYQQRLDDVKEYNQTRANSLSNLIGGGIKAGMSGRGKDKDPNASFGDKGNSDVSQIGGSNFGGSSDSEFT